MKTFNNEISKALIKDLTQPKIYGATFLLIFLTLLNVFLFWNEELKPLIIVESIIFVVITIVFTLNYLSEKSSPKYISVGKERIKIINLRGKKEVISWSDIDEIEWIGEYHSSAEKYPDYLISLKGRIFPNRYVSPEIGERLKNIFETYKRTGKLGDIPRTEVPFYKTATGGLLLLIITFFSIFFSAILTVIYLL